MTRLDRKQSIQLRKQVENRKEKEKAIVERLLPFLDKEKKIGAYIPIQGEVDIYSDLKERYTMYVPKVISETEMVFCKDTHLKPGKFQILEPDIQDAIAPEELDILLIPMVAFDYPCRRGYGKGYYDRYLKKCPALRIGIAFDIQQTSLQARPWDENMDWIITETRTIGGNP